MSDQNETHRAHTGRGKRHLLLIVLIWIVYTAVIVVSAAPRISRSIAESGVVPLIASRRENGSDADVRTLTACFFLSDGTDELFSQQWEKGTATVYHDAIENLLAGPGEEALRRGAVSFIADGTHLIGLTLSNDILYIDLSAAFLQSTDMQKAYRQVKRTAEGAADIRDIVLLVEGVRFSDPAGNPPQ